jgi:hypothetical protein
MGAIYSIGGCVALEVARRLGEAGDGHLDHFWRRPTIALMSNPVSRFHFDLHELPPAFVNYFVNDAAGAHLKEIERLPAGSTVVIDITRDIFTGVVEVEPGAFVMNPLDGVGIVAGLTTETMSSEVLTRLLKAEPKIINPLADKDRFLKLWKAAIDQQISVLSQKFENIILLEIYFTFNLASHDRKAPFSEIDVRESNSILSSMYDYIRDRKELIFASISQDKMMTGRHVAWDGPFYTHFVDESYALFCDEIKAKLTQDRHSGESFLQMSAFKRAKDYEDLRETFDTLLVQHDQTKNTLAAIQQRNAELEQMTEQGAATRIAELEHAQAAAAEHAQKIAQAKSLIADLRQHQARLEAEIAEARRPLAARLAKSTARRTYRLRRHIGLTPGR